MGKNSVIISVSMPKELAEFMDRQNLSGSEIIQNQVSQQMRDWELRNKETERILANFQSLQAEHQRVLSFLEEISKFEEYYKWRSERVLAKKV